jgi:predicted nucleic acid-binding Zn ribbon protein
MKIRSIIDEEKEKNNLPISIYEYKCCKCETEFEKYCYTDDDMNVSCLECNIREVTKKTSVA